MVLLGCASGVSKRTPLSKKLKSKRAAVKVSDADIDEVIVRMQQSFASKKEAEREAKNGDEAVIDFVGKKDDVAFDGGKSDCIWTCKSES